MDQSKRVFWQACLISQLTLSRFKLLAAPLLIRQEKTVTGSFYGTAHNHRDFNKYCNLSMTGKLPIDKLITHRYSIEQINQAIDDMLSGEIGRGVIVFE